jgi:uncharacterized protein involved in copper resistance
LRYEFRRELAPYVGLTRERMFGATADLARAAGLAPTIRASPPASACAFDDGS